MMIWLIFSCPVKKASLRSKETQRVLEKVEGEYRGKERVDAVHFELLFQVNVELGKALQGQFLHHVDSLTGRDVGFEELLSGLGESG